MHAAVFLVLETDKVYGPYLTWAGRWIHLAGEFEESGHAKRAAVSVGPQYGTVDEEWVRGAAIEAARDGFDLLVVCGMAFDGYLAGEFKQLGNLPNRRYTGDR